MNNSTRNFTNSSNTQNTQNTANSSSKFKKLATAAALAGALIAGGASYQYFKKDKVEAKTENTVGTNNEENLNDGKTVVLTDIQQTNRENEGSENDDAEYDRAILEIDMALENERITRDSIKLVEEIKKIDEDAKRIAKDRERIAKDRERIAKNRKNARAEMEALWASVDAEVFKSSKEVQDALDEYFQWAKEN